MKAVRSVKPRAQAACTDGVSAKQEHFIPPLLLFAAAAAAKPFPANNISIRPATMTTKLKAVKRKMFKMILAKLSFASGLHCSFTLTYQIFSQCNGKLHEFKL